MKRFLVSLLLVAALAPLAFAGGQQAKPFEGTITLWTKEGEADGGLQFVEAIAKEYSDAHPGVTIEVVKKENVEVLREDFQTASLAGDAPQLLWTVSDHAGPFSTADLIKPLDDYFDFSRFTAGVQLNGQNWAVPNSAGNHLMLLYNKDLLPEAPQTTDEMIADAKALTDIDNGQYGLVFNQTEPFWAAPWLGGFGGKVFADDGVTPTLNTPAMVNTLQFLYDLKFTDQVIPPESDYAGADTLFKEGKAAMLINGDWSLGDYLSVFGDKLGIAPMPKVSSTGLWPAPYTSGQFYMVSSDVTDEEMAVIVDFINYTLSDEVQGRQVELLKRLPATKSAANTPAVQNDPVLAASNSQLVKGTPMPVNLEMRCVWDSWKPELIAVMSGSKTPAKAAEDMQAAAVSCIAANE